MSIYYQNVRGLRSKLNILSNNIPIVSHYDVIVFTETWLIDSIHSSELGLNNYEIYRYDRNQPGVSRGGGCIIAIDQTIKSSPVIVDNDNLELICATFKIKSKRYILCTVYIPPGSSSDLYLKYSYIVDELISRYPTSTVLLTGDYNLPNVTWDPSSCSPIITRNNAGADIIISSSQFHRLFQLNHIQNNNNTILDLVFSNDSQNIRVVTSDEELIQPDPHHPPLIIEILRKKKFGTSHKSNINNANNNSHVIRNYKSGDYSELSTYLTDSYNRKFNDLPDSDLDTLVESFYDVLSTGIELYIPQKVIIPPKFPVWFSSELKNLVLEKKKVHSRYKALGCRRLYAEFSLLRTQCKKISSRDYSAFIQDVENELSSNPKKLWNFISNKKKDSGNPPIMHLDNMKSDDSKTIANLFARNFFQNYSSDSCPKIDLDYNTHININLNFEFEIVLLYFYINFNIQCTLGKTKKGSQVF